MGQYHKLVNLDALEYVDPSGLGLGAKQYEHTGCEGSLSDAMYLLCMSSPSAGGGDFPLTDVSGRWCGDRVLILGDYTECIPNLDDEVAFRLYGDVHSKNGWRDISEEVRKAFDEIFQIDYELKELKGFDSPLVFRASI